MVIAHFALSSLSTNYYLIGVTIQFAHVGNDQGARQLLTRLKNTTDKTIEGNIDCLLGEKLEHIVTPEKTWDLVSNKLHQFFIIYI